MTVRALAAGGIGGGDEPKVLFDAILHPNRSLGRRGFIILMAVAAIISLTVGGIFLLAGAWPVFGLYGLDFAILYWAFRANYHDGGRTEQIRLTPDRLTVERRDLWGNRSTCAFQPYWLTVTVEERPGRHSELILSSHGRSLAVGGFLSPDERLDLAKALQAALERARQPDTAPA